MSGAKHTPGPWVATRDRYGVTVRAVDRKPIADIWQNGDNPDANASLIAAGPEMLAALKLISGMDIYHEALAAVDAAIAKAEGRS